MTTACRCCAVPLPRPAVQSQPKKKLSPEEAKAQAAELVRK